MVTKKKDLFQIRRSTNAGPHLHTTTHKRTTKWRQASSRLIAILHHFTERRSYGEPQRTLAILGHASDLGYFPTSKPEIANNTFKKVFSNIVLLFLRMFK